MLKLLTWVVGTITAVSMLLVVIVYPAVLAGMAAIFFLVALVDGSFRKKPDDRTMPGPR